MFVFRLDLDAVQTQALLLVQRNLFSIKHQTIERIDRVHPLRGDDGVLGGVMERTEVRRDRLTGAQLIGCRLEFALIQGNHVQLVGVVAGDIPVFDAGIQILDRTSAVPAEGIHAALAAVALVAVPFMSLAFAIQIAAGDINQHGLILDAHCTGIWNGRLQVGHIDIDVETRMRRQRYGDGIRNGLRVGLLLAALVGLFHAIGVGKALLDLGGGRKRGQNGHAEFDAYRGLLGPVLRIGIGDRGRGRSALFIGIALLDRVFEVVAVFRRHLVAVRAAAQIKLVALLLERRRCVVRRDGGRLKPVRNALNFEVVERLHIVAVAGAVVAVVLARLRGISLGFISGGIKYGKFPFRQLVDDSGAIPKTGIVNRLSYCITQTLVGVFQIVCAVAVRCKVLVIKVFSAYIVIRIKLCRQNIVRNSRPLLRKFGILDHLLQNLLLCARQIVGV